MSTAQSIGPEDVLKTSLVLLGAAFNRAVDKAVATAYWIALRDLTPEEISLATERALATCKFFPAAAELRALVGRARNVPAEAALAWQAVRAALAKHDYLVASIDFGPRVNAVLRNLGGWDTLCRATLGELDSPGWLRKRFEEVYGLFAEKDADQLQGDPLGPTAEARGMRGVSHVRVAIAGQPAPRQISGRMSNGAGVLGLLAKEKSA